MKNMLKYKFMIFLILSSFTLNDVYGGVIVRNTREISEATPANGESFDAAVELEKQTKDNVITTTERNSIAVDAAVTTASVAVGDGAAETTASAAAGATTQIPNNINEEDIIDANNNNNNNNAKADSKINSDTVVALKNENIIIERTTNSIINEEHDENVDERNATTETSAIIKTNDVNPVKIEDETSTKVSSVNPSFNSLSERVNPDEDHIENDEKHKVLDGNTAESVAGNAAVINENDNSSNLNTENHLLMEEVENNNTRNDVVAAAVIATTTAAPNISSTESDLTFTEAITRIDSVLNEIKANGSVPSSEKRAKYLELTQEKRVPYDDLIPDFLNVTDKTKLNNNINRNNNNNNHSTSNTAAEIYALASMINVEQALKDADSIDRQDNKEDDNEEQDAEQIIKNNADILGMNGNNDTLKILTDWTDILGRMKLNNDTFYNNEDSAKAETPKAGEENLSSENRIITNTPVIALPTTTPTPRIITTTPRDLSTTIKSKFQLNDVELEDESIEEQSVPVTTENPVRYYERNTLPTNEAIQKETDAQNSRITDKSDTVSKISDIIQKIPTPTTTTTELPDAATSKYRPELTSLAPGISETDEMITEALLPNANNLDFQVELGQRVTDIPIVSTTAAIVTTLPSDDNPSTVVVNRNPVSSTPFSSSITTESNTVAPSTNMPDVTTSAKPPATTIDTISAVINEISKFITTESNNIATTKPETTVTKSNKFVMKTTTMASISTTDIDDTDDDAFEGQQSTIAPTFVDIKSIVSTTIGPEVLEVESTSRIIPIENAPEQNANPPTTMTTWTTTSTRSTKIIVTNAPPEAAKSEDELRISTTTEGNVVTNRSTEADIDDSNSEVVVDGEDDELTTPNSSLPIESQPKPEEEGSDVNVIIAISVSVIGVIALVLLIGFLLVMRKRQKQMTYGQRCRPVGLDAYSLDNVSVFNSVRRKAGNLRLSKRSYGNTAFEDPSLRSHVVTTTELATFVQNKNSIYEEFKDVPQVTARSDEVPAGCEDKNRYANVVPLPETRVHLKRLNDDELTEYINANYVKGPKDTSNYYIACQAPLDSTIVDFWRMIWEQNSKVIIMATDLTENGVEKCAEYLPPSAVLDNNRQFGDYQVTLKNREMKEKYALSIIHLKNNQTNTWREIVHIWYQWPNDTSTPTEETSVIAMLLEARSYLKLSPPEQYDTEALNKIIDGDDEEDVKTTLAVPEITEISEKTDEGEEKEKGIEEKPEKNNVSQSNNNGIKSLQRVQGPLTVHCSPGTGRTGTIIACDIALRQLEIPPRQIDIPKIVYYVRRSRASSVRAKEQYEFIYKVANLYATKLTGPVVEN